MEFQAEGSEYIFKTFGPEGTVELGKIMGSELAPGDIVALIGELGTGKTCFVRGLAIGLGIDKTVPISSPSFTIINEYPGAVPLYHFDFYRIDNVSQIFDLGYEEYFFGEGVTAIEWGEKFGRVLPKKHIRVQFFFQDDDIHRKIKITGSGKRFIQRMKSLGAKVKLATGCAMIDIG